MVMRKTTYLLIVGLLTVMANVALGDKVSPEASGNDPMWQPNVISGILGAIIIGVSIFNPKRGHQD